MADSVITALSNFARLPVPNLRPISVMECVREALENNPLPASVQVVSDGSTELPRVLADVDQLRIVFSNLIRNARDAMPAGGQLSIHAQPRADAVEVTVTDTGVGISPENLHRIMDPLYSTKARGLGLGLAITKAILEKSKGNLRVVSEMGIGSTFTVRLLAAHE
jgi:signal transduction histidine kinase